MASKYAITPTDIQIRELGRYLFDLQRDNLDFIPEMPEWYKPVAAAFQANATLGEEYKIAPWNIPEEWIDTLAGCWHAATVARVMKSNEGKNNAAGQAFGYSRKIWDFDG